ncbi:MAG: [FeFe] hydrogenase H-cluster maturation GTPase HydF [Candidatus Omnitrophota bacterium]
MQNTPLSNRLHIGIFGRVNVGKSSLINALTDQDTAIVSETPGTTTDPVHKAMEIHGLGPVVVFDTGGIDDAGALGAMCVDKTFKVLNKTDVSLLVLDKREQMGVCEENFLKEVKNRGIPCIAVINKCDVIESNDELKTLLKSLKLPFVEVSALKRSGLDALRDQITQSAPEDFERKIILADLLRPGDTVVLVAPLDIEAPKGRLKLPQVQTIRDVLDAGCQALILKEDILLSSINDMMVKPRLVIAESQVLSEVARILPKDIPLTSFSMLYARYKGDLEVLARGAKAVDLLNKDSRILIAEACTHHPVGEDVGRVVIPELIRKRLGFDEGGLRIDYAAGYQYPDNLQGYDLVIHCGGCMLNRRQMMHRLASAAGSHVAITNYGMLIAYCSGILDRSLDALGIRQIPAANAA